MSEEQKEVPPEEWAEEMGVYLLALRDSAVTNMMGAGPYLQEEFGLTRSQARECLLYWFSTFKG